MTISNSIFEHYRIKQIELKKAVNLLRRNGYSVKKPLKTKTK
tara:strand:- start:922 stop:1047 length:126 start_codon:yes stop_codon:yes gene_type:complete